MTPWLDKKEYPFESRYYDVNGHRLHFIDEGSGETLLFVHGTPSWSFDWRLVIKTLRNQFRCIAIDHIGFGLSEKPAEYDYSTINHSRTLERFVLAKDLRNVTLVVHDFGGPIGLSFAIRHPERVKRLVILNSWMWDHRGHPDFEKVAKVLRSPLIPFLYKWFNFSPRYILPRAFGDRKLRADLLKQYTGPFQKRSERLGPLAFVNSLLNDHEWFGELWSSRQMISSKPTLFIWGMKDPTVRPHNLDHFLSGFPTASVIRLSGCGHFPQEEEPEQVSQGIIEWTRLLENSGHLEY